MTVKKAAKPAAKKPRAKKAEKVIKSIKGFNRDMTCLGFQFEPGKTYTHEGEVECCATGFHACTSEAHPLSVFNYYAPGISRYFEVEQRGPFSSNDNVKIASARITIGVELSIYELTKRAIEWVFKHSKPEGETATGARGAASATGKKSAAMAAGYEGSVSGSNGCALFALERDDNWNIVSTASGIVGKDGIEPDTFYKCKGGKLVSA